MLQKQTNFFYFLLEKGQIKLLANHVILPPNKLKNKKFCKYHNTTSHTTNDCRIFWQHIQRAIQQGKLKFDTAQKMKVDDNPFPKIRTWLILSCSKGKLKF